MNRKKILLISMPWAQMDLPSIQLGVLSAYLRQHGFLVDSKYYYLIMADILTIDIYQALVYYPFDFSIFYPELVKLTNSEYSYKKKVLAEYLSKKLSTSLDDIISKVELFKIKINKEIEYFDKYDIIGFTINYNQELPSLHLAQSIKDRYPEKTVIFGGSLCYQELGETLLKKFDFIDIVVSGEGEETLIEIIHSIRNNDSLANIQGISYRLNQTIIRNPSRIKKIPLDDLPFPYYDDYFQQYNNLSNLNSYSHYNIVKIPIEGSRGCWWNKCTFCGLNRQFIDNETNGNFKTKTSERIVQEINYLHNRYQINKFCFLDNVQYKIQDFCKNLHKVVDYDLNFFIECRATITHQDLYAMKKVGFREIQIGIESLSNKILNKMLKGTTVIQNINALKWCKFFEIKPHYNMIRFFPLESLEDIQEIINVSKKILHFSPPTLVDFHLDYASPIYNNTKKFNIKNYSYPKKFEHIYDANSNKAICPTYNYQNIIPLNTEKIWNKFSDFLKKWNENKNKTLTYEDHGTFLRIIDLRDYEQHTIILNSFEKELYLYCHFIRTKKDVINKFSNMDMYQISDILQSFIDHNLMYEEKNKYISLALPNGEFSKHSLLKMVSWSKNDYIK